MGEVKRYSVWDGEYTGSEYYNPRGEMTQKSHDVYSHWDGRYLYTDHYDVRTGEHTRSYEGPHD